MSSIDLSLKKQTLLLQYLGSSPELFIKCSSIVKANYFDPELRKTVQFLQDYYNKYNGIPTPLQINAETGFDLEPIELQRHEVEYCSDNVEEFCRTQAVVDEVSKSAIAIAEGNLSDIVERIRDAVMISLDKDMGTSFFESEEEIQRRMEERILENPATSTGWDNLDRLMNGGLRRGELCMFSAGSGVGKSIALTNSTLSFCLRGYNVLYISLELQEDMIVERMEMMLTGPNTREEKAADAAGLSKIIKSKSKNAGRIDIKYMAADEANSNMFLAYIKEYEAQHGFPPDALVVDYLDIMATNERMQNANAFDVDKKKATQLRAIGNSEYNMFMLTASQENRSAVGETEKSHAMIAGGLSKINTVDYYISIIMTDGMRAMGVADFLMLKARSSDGVGKRAAMTWNPEWLLFEAMKGDDGIKKSSTIDVDMDKDVDVDQEPDGTKSQMADFFANMTD